MNPQTCFLRAAAVLWLIPVLFSCHPGQQSKTADGWPGIADSTAAGMLGSYSGSFKNGLLTLVINYVSGNIVSGYDLHKGIRRNLNGRIEEKDGQYALVLKEPGGNPFDGAFYLTMDRSAQKIKGSWVPTDSSRTHSGTLSLVRADRSNNNGNWDYSSYKWQGDPGTITFNRDNSCQLEYYLDSDSAATNPNALPLVVHGNYAENRDIFEIDWQDNNHTPTLHMYMHLIKDSMTDLHDSLIWKDAHGKDVVFINIGAK